MPTNSGYNWIKKEEGFLAKATRIKKQSGGREKNRTIGYGYNLDAAENPRQDLMDVGIPSYEIPLILNGRKRISKEQGDKLFEISVRRATSDASRVIPNFHTYDPEIRDVLIAMAYQMGPTGLNNFKNMKTALVQGDYPRMAKEILDSKFAREDSTSRAKRTAQKVLDYAKDLPPPPPKKSPEELQREAERETLIKRLSRTYSSEMKKQKLVEKYKEMKLAEAEQAKEETSKEDSTDGSSQ